MRVQKRDEHTQRPLAESEVLYRLIAERSTDMISKHTPEGIYTYASPACRSLLGYEPEDLVGHDAYEFFHPEDLQEIRKAHSAILKLPDVYSVACRIRRKDGTYTWFETTSKAIRDEQTDEVKEIIAVSRDVTERKRAQEELRYQLELTGTITRNAADALFLLNREGRITFTNPAARRIFGWSQEELIGEVLHDKVHHHRPDRSPYPLSECPLNMVLTSGQTLHDHEDVFFSKDDSPIFVACSSAPIIIEGQVTGLVVVVRDVTERKQAEEQVRKSNQRIVRILESITENSYALDTEWRFTYLNERTLSAIRRAKGEELDREDLLGKNIWELLPELVGSDLYRKYHEAVREQKPIHLEAYSALRDAWVEAHAYPSEEGLSIYVQDITERKRAEEALRESRETLRKSEEFHRFAVEAGRIGTWDLNLQTEECLISPKMAELMGFSPNQKIVPVPQWREAIVPDDRTLMESILIASIDRDAPFDLEFRIALKDGTERWLYSRGGVSRDASGKALRVHGASIDVTERKQAEEKLRQSEERLRRAIGIETVGVIFFSADGSITDANDAFLRMSGYSREDLARGLVRWDEMTPPEWMPHSLKAIEEFESTGRTLPYEKEYIRKDGSRWWGLFAATRLDEEEGVEFIIDITESKRAEEDLRRSNRRIVNILESITDAFFAVDRQWKFTYVNQQAEQVWQRSREELLGKNLWEEFPESVGSTFYEKYRQAVQVGTPVYFEEFYAPLGIWVEVHAYPTRGEGLAVYFQDVTKRKRAEEALLEIREAERRRIARDLHDTVLQDLSGALQGLQAVQLEFDSADYKADLKRETEALRKAARGLREAVHDLRQEQEKPFVTAIESLVEYNRQLTPERNLRLSVQEGFPQELPDPVKLELLRTIQEALSNIRQHSDAQWIGVKLHKRQDRVCAEVVDDGRGFDPESVRRGLGLLGMRERIETFGGELEIRSRVGKGTMVSVTVPTQTLADEKED